MLSSRIFRGPTSLCLCATNTVSGAKTGRCPRKQCECSLKLKRRGRRTHLVGD